MDESTAQTQDKQSDHGDDAAETVHQDKDKPAKRDHAEAASPHRDEAVSTHRDESEARAIRAGKLRMRDSRKFRALLLAIFVYAVPILMTFTLCLKGRASFPDLFETMKWMAGALSPAFLAYIGGVAWEKTKTA